jgi:hypothetical protein
MAEMRKIKERQAVPSHVPDPNQTMIRLTMKHHCLTSLTLLLCLVATLRSLAAEAAFAGEWDTTFGRLSLKVDGKVAVGTYCDSGGAVNDLKGEIDDGKLTFTYSEPSATGDGYFTLSTDGQGLSGNWREKGESSWRSWDGRRLVVKAGDFSGVWKTSFGMMRLNQDGEKVSGCYTSGEQCEITGTVKSGILTFTYKEPLGIEGSGDFTLSPDAAAFAGKWKANDGKSGEWEATREVPVPGRIWLVVLEANWEENLRENEYSYGAMLKQFFTQAPSVVTRHRYFDESEDFAKWCSELQYINEPVVLYISSHGTEAGITVGKNTLSGEFIGQQLRHARNIKLVHLGACLTMAGNAPTEIRAASGLKTPISGYTKEADWAGSAVIDFMLLDLILCRQIPPAEAVRQVQKSMTFAGEKDAPDSIIKATGLKILE